MTRTPISSIPLNYKLIQYNCCYNPNCVNFLVPPSKISKEYAHKVKSSGAGVASINCGGCSKSITLKSNEAIASELYRLSRPMSSLDHPTHTDACPNKVCGSFNKKASYNQELYKKNGKTKSGNQRFTCRRCKATFTDVKTKEKRKPNTKVDIEKRLFKEMVNKAPVRGSLDINGISARTYYDKLNRFAEKCAQFTYKREKRLKELTKGRKYNLCTDRQDYVLNWTDRKNKVNTTLTGIGTADLFSGYVFGVNLNFDPTAEYQSISQMEESTSAKFAQHHRKYAHLWMPRDVIIASKSAKEFRKLQKELNTLYVNGMEKDVIERDHLDEINEKVGMMLADAKDGWADSTSGARVHSEYTMFAHFLWLADKFSNSKKINFYLDQESGIERAVLNAFSGRRFNGDMDAFLLTIDKGEYTVDEKKRMREESVSELQAIMEHKGISFYEAQLEMLESACCKLEVINKKEWLRFPYSDMKEPNKLVHWLTRRELPENEIAKLYQPASLHGIDRFFMIARRKISTLERPISSQGTVGRKWHSTAAYSPEMVEKRLMMLRTYRNYVFTGKDGKTPAMRIGLAEKPIDLTQIIHR